MGSWPFSASKMERYTKYLISLLYEILSFITVWGEINQLLIYVDIAVFTEGICVFVTAIISSIKNMLTLVKRRQLQKMILLTNDLYINTPIDENIKLQKINFEAKRNSTLFGKSFFFLMLSVLFTYSCFPWITFLTQGKKVFQYPSQFPIDMDNWAQFLTFYFIEVLVGYRVIVTFSADTLFANFVSFICTRMDVVIESLKVSIEETSRTEKTNQIFKDCVIYQQKIYM